MRLGLLKISKMTYPTWLTGNLPSNQSAHTDGSLPVRRLISQGKPITCKAKVNDAEIKRLSNSFVHQLNRALEARASELTDLHIENAIPLKLAVLIQTFFQHIIKLNDETTKHAGRSPPKTLSNALRLLPVLKEFEINTGLLIPLTRDGLLLCTVLNELFDDVLHFVGSIQITHGIVKVVQGRPTLPNRPSNIIAMKAYAAIVNAYQVQHGAEKFPKPSAAHKQMQALGHAVPARTLRDWKRQMKNRTFGDYVQNRKRQ
jgi:hypothetical protein